MTDKKNTKVTFRLTPERGSIEIEDSNGNIAAGNKADLTVFCAETGIVFSPTEDEPMPRAGNEEAHTAIIKAGLSEDDVKPTTLDHVMATLRSLGIVDSPPRTIEREANLGQMPSPLEKACDAISETEIASKPGSRDGRG